MKYTELRTAIYLHVGNYCRSKKDEKFLIEIFNDEEEEEAKFFDIVITFSHNDVLEIGVNAATLEFIIKLYRWRKYDLDKGVSSATVWNGKNLIEAKKENHEIDFSKLNFVLNNLTQLAQWK